MPIKKKSTLIFNTIIGGNLRFMQHLVPCKHVNLSFIIFQGGFLTVKKIIWFVIMFVKCACYRKLGYQTSHLHVGQLLTRDNSSLDKDKAQLLTTGGYYLETEPGPISMVIRVKTIHPQAQPYKYILALHGYSCTTSLQVSSICRACGWIVQL